MTSAAAPTRSPRWQVLLLAAIAVLAAIGLGWLLSGIQGSGTDMYFSFRTPVLLWLSGQTHLNDSVPYSGFYHPPWMAPVVALFAVWPYRWSIALLAAASLLILGAGALVFSRGSRWGPWALALALFNLHTFDMLFRGQLTGFEVAGVALAWPAYRKQNPWLMGLAYFTLMLVPPNTIPIALYLAWITWQRWPRKSWLTSFAIPIGVVLASFVFFGWWPPRWVANEVASPHQVNFLTTIWRMADVLGLPGAAPLGIAAGVIALAVWAWRRAGARSPEETDLAHLMLVITTTLMLTPYSLSYRLVLLLACVMPWLSRWRLDILIGLYLLTFLPLVRLFIGRDNSWIDLAFVTAAFLATVFYVGLARRQAVAPQGAPANG